MNLQINNFADIAAFIQNKTQNTDDSLFRDAVENAVSMLESSTSGCVVVSPKLEGKFKDDPEFAEEIARKIAEMTGCYGKTCREKIVVVDKNGEITGYCPKHDKNKDYPTSEQLKELAKARARKKARLDAYFKLVERISVKRKLVEQENLKRAANKKYRYSPDHIDMLAKSILQKPSKTPEYYSM